MKVRLADIRNTESRREHGDIEGLKASIAAVGLINPLSVDQDLHLLAGRRRYQALMELYGPDHGVDVREIPVNGDDLKAFAIALAENIHRKDLTDPEIAAAIKEYDELKRKLEGERKPGGAEGVYSTGINGQGWTQTKTAKDLGISQPAVAKAVQIATAIEKYPELAGWNSGQAILREYRKRTVEAPAWPKGKYRVIYADPPWEYSNTMPDYFPEQGDHYATMPLADICALSVDELGLDDAVLFLWATSPILEDAFKVINAWRFQYRASIVWHKDAHNMGHYVSVRHEFLLICVRGSCMPDINKLLPSVITEKRSVHSSKPEIFRQMIDQMYPYGPRIELFARRQIDNWDAWGSRI